MGLLPTGPRRLVLLLFQGRAGEDREQGGRREGRELAPLPGSQEATTRGRGGEAGGDQELALHLPQAQGVKEVAGATHGIKRVQRDEEGRATVAAVNY